MTKNEITDLENLYEKLKDNSVRYEGETKKELILQYTLDEVMQNQFKGRLTVLKRIILSIYPLKYLWAYMKARKIIYFRKEDYRMKLSQAATKDIIHNISKYEQVYKLLDENSKQVYLNMLMYRITGNFKFSISSKSQNQQYFSDKIIWKKNMTIVDCGAFCGDTLLAFIEKKISIKNYYMYEPDNDNYTKMQAVCRLAEERGINIYPMKKGVYSYSTTLYFESNTDSSRLVDYPTKTSVEVASIDDDIQDKVDFIKMDVEGSELYALNGAIKIIKKYKPVLAICIYHNQKDFWKIPLRIREICPEYARYWVEQYSVWDIETVLFVSL